MTLAFIPRRTNRRAAVRRTPVLAVLVAIAMTMVFSPDSARAQSARLRIAERGPYHAGLPISLRVDVEGSSDDSPPRYEVPDPGPGAQLMQRGSTAQNTSIRIVNGRRQKSVTYQQGMTFIADEPGTYTVGPVRVIQGSTELKTQTVSLRLEPIPTTDEMAIRLQVPSTPLTIGQRVAVPLVWELGEDFAPSVNQGLYTIRVPFFDATDAFAFEDPEPDATGGNRVALRILTESGEIRLPATVEQKSVDGKMRFTLKAGRVAIPRRPGSHALAPTSVVAQEVLAWRRDLFGSRSPSRTRPVRSRDLERTVTVEKLPADAPPSFAGAVGKGFNIAVTADRTVVRAGDPIKLTITVRGAGNVETAALPNLSEDEGLTEDLFQLPERSPAGRFDSETGAKTFEVTVRPRSGDVREIPAIAYSWFDPEARRYQTTRSQPIALSVTKAEIIGADEVVSSASESPPRDTVANDSGSASSEPGSIPGRRSTGLDRVGADLSLATDASGTVAIRSRPPLGPELGFALYAAGLLAIAFAFVARRRGEVDPRVLAQRRELVEVWTALEKACREGGRDGLDSAAQNLRRFRSLAHSAIETRNSTIPSELLHRVDEILSRAESVLYAPTQDAASVSPILEDLRAVASELREEVR